MQHTPMFRFAQIVALCVIYLSSSTQATDFKRAGDIFSNSQYSDSIADYGKLDQKQTYYVSSTLGDDALPDSLAKRESSPWKSIARINKLKLQPGDAILFKRGDLFSGTLNLLGNGTESNRIFVGSYGVGQDPQIRGDSLITGWKKIDASTWAAPFSGFVGALYINSHEQNLSRYPDSGYLSIDSVYSDSQFTIQGEIPEKLQGSTANVQTVNWSLYSRLVTSVKAGLITVVKNTSYPYKKGQQVYFNNGAGLLSSPNEWFYDDQMKSLNLHSESEPSTVSVMTTDYGIIVRKSSYITIRDLNIQYSRRSGVMVRDSSHNITLKNLYVKHSGNIGIEIQNGDSMEIGFSHIRDCSIIGISSKSSNTKIHNCQITRIGLNTNKPGGFEQGGGIGIKSEGPSTDVSHNRLDSLGYAGIIFTWLHRITKNVISDFCLTLHDGGGVYSQAKTFQANVTDGSSIKQNIIVLSERPARGQEVEGVYMDDRTKACLIDSNVIINTRMGVYLHNSKNHLVTNNVVFSPGISGFYLNENVDFKGQMTENKVSQNKTYLVYLQTVAMSFSKSNGPSLIGSIDNNSIFGSSSNLIYSVNEYNGSPAAYLSVNGVGHLGYEQSNTKEVIPLNLDASLPANLLLNGSFEKNTKSWVSANPLNQINWIQQSTMGKGIAQIDLTNMSSTARLVSSSPFGLTKDTQYLLKFKIQGVNAGKISVMIRKNGGDYHTLGYNQTFWFDTDDFYTVFTATETLLDARLDFGAVAETPVFWLDDVSLQEYTAPTMHIAVNDGLNYRVFALPKGAVTPKGEPLATQVVIKPFDALVYVSPVPGDFAPLVPESEKRAKFF